MTFPKSWLWWWVAACLAGSLSDAWWHEGLRLALHLLALITLLAFIFLEKE